MFNWKQYWFNYPDLRHAPEMHSPHALIAHYHEHGRHEIRTDKEEIIFDSLKYWRNYPDLQSMTTHDQLLEHYFHHGYAEKRFIFSCNPGHSRRNILYLINHKTLTDFEVPILVNKQYGVYIPKIYKSVWKFHSINNKTDTFDDSLNNIKMEDFCYLNGVDFFDPSSYTDPHLMNILNKYFGVIFITPVLKGKIVNKLSQSFEGKIFYRFFGVDSDRSYYKALKTYDIDLEKLSERVQYIFSYQEIIDFEFSKNNVFNPHNSFFVPLGIPDAFFENYENTYHPIEPRFVFVVSNVDIVEYYYDIYDNFNTLCKDFNFIILGKNNDEIEKKDFRFRNQLPDKEYFKAMRESIAMYYHSREPRHVHYHPLEALVIGLPVIFYSDSLLATSFLKGSPGECKDEKEVLLKLSLLRDGDVELKTSILKFQEPIKETLRMKNNWNIFNSIL